MSKTENVELTVLCLIEDGDKILLQNRVKKIHRKTSHGSRRFGFEFSFICCTKTRIPVLTGIL